jgi:hypothetical protein
MQSKLIGNKFHTIRTRTSVGFAFTALLLHLFKVHLTAAKLTPECEGNFFFSFLTNYEYLIILKKRGLNGVPLQDNFADSGDDEQTDQAKDDNLIR